MSKAVSMVSTEMAVNASKVVSMVSTEVAVNASKAVSMISTELAMKASKTMFIVSIEVPANTSKTMSMASTEVAVHVMHLRPCRWMCQVSAYASKAMSMDVLNVCICLQGIHGHIHRVPNDKIP